jgi:hypothetical protein
LPANSQCATDLRKIETKLIVNGRSIVQIQHETAKKQHNAQLKRCGFVAGYYCGRRDYSTA